MIVLIIKHDEWYDLLNPNRPNWMRTWPRALLRRQVLRYRRVKITIGKCRHPQKFILPVQRSAVSNNNRVLWNFSEKNRPRMRKPFIIHPYIPKEEVRRYRINDRHHHLNKTVDLTTRTRPRTVKWRISMPRPMSVCLPTPDIP